MAIHVDEDFVRQHCKRLGLPIPPELGGGEKWKKPPKYRNIPTEADGKVYASAREARRHGELKLLWKAGKIRGFAEQVTFLLPGDIRYVADFVVLENGGTYRVEDTKGFRTKEYRLKKKLMRRELNIEIHEI